MRLQSMLVVTVFVSILSMGTANSQNPIDDAINGCAAELKAHCSTVKPGNGRLVACIKAHEDKVSSKCVFALNRADFRLNTLELFLNYVAFQCKDDAVKNCSGIKLGDRRVLKCLAKNQSKLKGNCVTALKDIGEIQ